MTVYDGNSGVAESPATGNLREFLGWVAARRRTYADVMEAWRTSCPRLSAWEDATSDDLMRVEQGDGTTQGEAVVCLTERGAAFLSPGIVCPSPEPCGQRAMSWSAKQYVAFEDERTRPVRDLVHAIPGTEARAVVDLGCGPGNSTEVFAARFPGAAVTGLDSSADMIEAARKRLPEFRFAVASVESWDEPGPFDAILANAVLHWVPDHAALLPRLVGKLAPGGSLAVQMPDNLDEPAHRLMREVAANGPWAGKLASAAGARTTMESAGWYYGLLLPHCTRVDVWRTTYHHPLAGGADAVVEWFKGSGLRPFLDPLDEAERAAYLDRYRAEVAGAYPALPNGCCRSQVCSSSARAETL